MHTGVYLQKSSKGLVPLELWELILKNNTSGMGVASAKIGGFAQKGSGAPTVDVLDAFQKEHLDDAILFYLYEATEDFNAEDIQPFVTLKDDKDNPLLAVFLDGPFDRHKEDDGHTSEYHAAFDYLQDRVMALYAISRGDVAKMLDLMRAKNFGKEVEAVLGEGNSVTMLANNGEIVSYGPVKDVVKYDWGWSTNYYGFGAAAKAEAPKAEAPKGMAALFAKKISDSKAEPKVNNPPAQTLQTVAVETKINKGPGLQETAAVLNNGGDIDKEIFVIPDETTHWSHNKLQKFYHKLQPAMARDDWKKRPPVKTSQAELIRLKLKPEEFPVKIIPASGLDKLQEYRAFESQEQKKKTEPAHVPQPTPAKPVDQVAKTNASVVSVIPRAPAEEAVRVVAIVQNAKGTISPEEFKGMERKFPTILDIAGLKEWDQLHKLDFDDIVKIVENKTAAAVMIMNLIGRDIRNTERLNSVADKAKERIAL